MTTTTPFIPQPNGPFVFLATLDGDQYQVSVQWVVYAQRWYVSVTDLSQNLIVYRALTGSPVAVNLQTVSWENGYATLVCSAPHKYIIGATVQVVISGCTPDVYNGTVQAIVIDAVTLVYPLAQNPNACTQLGFIVWNINLVYGYFKISTLVYRVANQSFEVNP